VRSKLIAAGTGAVLVAGVIWTATSVGATTRPERGTPAEFTETTVDGFTFVQGNPVGPDSQADAIRAARGIAAGASAVRRSAQERPVSNGGVGADFDGDGEGDIVLGNVSTDLDGMGAVTGAGVVISYSSQPVEGITHWLLEGTTAAPALAAGDFDNDGFDDLVWGAHDDAESQGVVAVLYGGVNGVGVDDDDNPSNGNPNLVPFTQDDVNETAEAGDQFGRSLAAGDINNDGFDDLVVGAPSEDLASTPGTGGIHQIPGNVLGLTLGGATFLTQGLPSVPGSDETNDQFGFSVAVGDVTGDGFDDVAVGAIGENGVGAVNLLRGSATGIDAAGATSRVALTTAAVTPQRLGTTLVIADLTNDGRSEVIVGDPLANVDGHTDSGAVSVWLGRAEGLNNTGREWWHQNRANVPGSAEAGDQFGTALTAGDVIGSSRDDLVVGVHNEDVGSDNRAGAFTVLVGASTATGLTGTGSRTVDQDATNVSGSPEPDDRFGSSLQIFAIEGLNVLVVGARGEQVSASNGPGSGSATYFGHVAGGGMDPFLTEIGPDYQLTNDSGDTVFFVNQLGFSSVQH
jgi:hypothetical protein